MYKVFIVEDDEKIVSLIKDKLERYGYAVSIADYYVKIKGY